MTVYFLLLAASETLEQAWGAATTAFNTGVLCVHKLSCTKACRKPSLPSPALRRTSIAH